MTREEEEIKQLKQLVATSYGAVCGLVGILAQLPDVAEVDIQKAIVNGQVMMPRVFGIPGIEPVETTKTVVGTVVEEAKARKLNEEHA